MAGVGILLRKELLEQWRTFRLPLVAVIFALIGLSSPLLARFTAEIVKAVAGDQFPLDLPPPTVADSVDQLAKNLNQLGALIAILIASSAVAPEKERGTAALILVRPVSRAGFLLAKLVALGVTFAVALVLAIAGWWFYTLVLFEALPIGGVLALGILDWLFLMAWVSLTFLASTLTRSTLAAAGLGVTALIVVGLLSIAPPLAAWLPIGLVPVAHALALGLEATDPWKPILGTVILIVVAVVLAWLSFRRQEL
jgi:ABC-2 type transport system permease protein